MAVTEIENHDSPRGLAFAITAYVIWGMLPIFMKAVAHIPAAEVIAHRVLWSVPLAGVVLIYLGRTNDLVAAFKTPRMLAMGCVTAALISVNWGVYVWAISVERTLDAALGYYINPIFSVALGALVLKERLSGAQMVAVALAAGAVVLLWLEAGRLPWVAVVLTVSWGFYAFFKKMLPIGPNQGFLLEVLLLTPPALGYLAWLAAHGQGHFGGTTWDTGLLMACGVITAVPLLVYANGAKLLKLSTIGILQYIAPTMIFLMAVVVFKEPFEGARVVAFPMIWAALVIYSVSMLRGLRAARS